MSIAKGPTQLNNHLLSDYNPCAYVEEYFQHSQDSTTPTNPVKDLLNLHQALCKEASNLMEAKNHDYTSGSGDPLANFRGATLLGVHPVLGIQLRQQDKMQRIKTFVEKGQLKVKGESVKDAIIDQINYLVLQYAFITEMVEQSAEEIND